MNNLYWDWDNPESETMRGYLEDMRNASYYDEYQAEQNKNKQLQADNEQLRAVIKKAITTNKELVKNLYMIKNTIIYRALKRVKSLFSYRIKLISVK